MSARHAITNSDLERAAAFLMLAAKIPTPTPEHRFHPTRGWRFDFAWPESLVALECEGGVFTGGRHVQGRAFTADCEKYAEAAALGWRVIRATAEQIDSAQFLDWVKRALAVGAIA